MRFFRGITRKSCYKIISTQVWIGVDLFHRPVVHVGVGHIIRLSIDSFINRFLVLKSRGWSRLIFRQYVTNIFSFSFFFSIYNTEIMNLSSVAKFQIKKNKLKTYAVDFWLKVEIKNRVLTDLNRNDQKKSTFVFHYISLSWNMCSRRSQRIC